MLCINLSEYWITLILTPSSSKMIKVFNPNIVILHFKGSQTRKLNAFETLSVLANKIDGKTGFVDLGC